MRRYLAFLGLALIAILGLGYWAGSLMAGPPAKRFVVTVTLTVDGRPMTGEAVWDMRSEKQESLGNGPPYRNSARGEAIPFPLSDNTVLFVLKRGSEFVSSTSYGAFLAECGAFDAAALAAFDGGCEVKDYPELLLAKGDVHGAAVPVLTLLRNGRVGDHAVDISSFSVRVTDQARSEGIAKAYAWIDALPSDQSYSVGKIYRIDFVAE